MTDPTDNTRGIADTQVVDPNTGIPWTAPPDQGGVPVVPPPATVDSGDSNQEQPPPASAKQPGFRSTPDAGTTFYETVQDWRDAGQPDNSFIGSLPSFHADAGLFSVQLRATQLADLQTQLRPTLNEGKTQSQIDAEIATRIAPDVMSFGSLDNAYEYATRYAGIDNKSIMLSQLQELGYTPPTPAYQYTKPEMTVTDPDTGEKIPIVWVGVDSPDTRQMIRLTPEMTALAQSNPQLYNVLIKEGVDNYARAVNADNFIIQQERRQFARLNTVVPDGEGSTVTISKADLENLKQANPELYQTLTTKGVKQFGEQIAKNEQEYNRQAKAYNDNQLALSMLQNYTDKDGGVDGAKYLRDNPWDTTTLANVNFSPEQVKDWQDYNNQPYVKTTPMENLYATIESKFGKSIYSMTFKEQQAAYSDPEIASMLASVRSNPDGITKPALSLVAFETAFLAARGIEDVDFRSSQDKLVAEGNAKTLADAEYARLYGIGTTALSLGTEVLSIAFVPARILKPEQKDIPLTAQELRIGAAQLASYVAMVAGGLIVSGLMVGAGAVFTAETVNENIKMARGETPMDAGKLALSYGMDALMLIGGGLGLRGATGARSARTVTVTDNAVKTVADSVVPRPPVITQIGQTLSDFKSAVSSLPRTGEKVLDKIDNAILGVTEEALTGKNTLRIIGDVVDNTRNVYGRMKYNLTDPANLSLLDKSLDALDRAAMAITVEALSGEKTIRLVIAAKGELIGLSGKLRYGTAIAAQDTGRAITRSLDTIDRALVAATSESLEGTQTIKALTDIRNNLVRLAGQVKYGSKVASQTAQRTLTNTLDRTDRFLVSATKEALTGKRMIEAVEASRREIVNLYGKSKYALSVSKQEFARSLTASLNRIDNSLVRMTEEALTGKTAIRNIEELQRSIKNTIGQSKYLGKAVIQNSKQAAQRAEQGIYGGLDKADTFLVNLTEDLIEVRYIDAVYTKLRTVYQEINNAVKLSDFEKAIAKVDELSRLSKDYQNLVLNRAIRTNLADLVRALQAKDNAVIASRVAELNELANEIGGIAGARLKQSIQKLVTSSPELNLPKIMQSLKSKGLTVDKVLQSTDEVVVRHSRLLAETRAYTGADIVVDITGMEYPGSRVVRAAKVVAKEPTPETTVATMKGGQPPKELPPEKGSGGGGEPPKEPPSGGDSGGGVAVKERAKTSTGGGGSSGRRQAEGEQISVLEIRSSQYGSPSVRPPAPPMPPRPPYVPVISPSILASIKGAVEAPVTEPETKPAEPVVVPEPAPVEPITKPTPFDPDIDPDTGEPWAVPTEPATPEPQREPRRPSIVPVVVPAIPIISPVMPVPAKPPMETPEIAPTEVPEQVPGVSPDVSPGVRPAPGTEPTKQPARSPAKTPKTAPVPTTAPTPTTITSPNIRQTPQPVTTPTLVPTPVPVPVPQPVPVPTPMPTPYPEPTPIPYPEPTPVPTPRPYPQPSPQPSPQPVPGRVPVKSSTSLPGIKKPPPVVILGLDSGDGERSKRIPPGSLTWAQGFDWKYIPPPWNELKPISLGKYPPAGARNTGSHRPAETLQIIGQSDSVVPELASVDLGFVDIYIKNGKTIEFQSGGLATDVGVGIISTTQGMSVSGVSPMGEAVAEETTTGGTDMPVNKGLSDIQATQRQAQAQELQNLVLRQIQQGKEVSMPDEYGDGFDEIPAAEPINMGGQVQERQTEDIEEVDEDDPTAMTDEDNEELFGMGDDDSREGGSSNEPDPTAFTDEDAEELFGTGSEKKRKVRRVVRRPVQQVRPPTSLSGIGY